MKNLFAIFLAMILSLQGYSQLVQGSHVIGGCLNLNSGKTSYSDNDNENSFLYYGLLPAYAYLFASHWSIGLSAGYNASKDEAKSTDINGDPVTQTYSTGLISINPQLQYYKGINERLFCSLWLALNLGFGNYKDEFSFVGSSSTSKGSTSQYGATLGGALTYFMAARYAMALNYGALQYYTSSSQPDGSDQKTTTSALDFNLNLYALSLAFYYYINCGDDHQEITR